MNNINIKLYNFGTEITGKICKKEQKKLIAFVCKVFQHLKLIVLGESFDFRTLGF